MGKYVSRQKDLFGLIQRCENEIEEQFNFFLINDYWL